MTYGVKPLIKVGITRCYPYITKRLMPMPRTTTKLMTVKQFSEVRGKYRDVADCIDEKLSEAEDDDRLKVRLEEGSMFEVTGVKVIKDKEDMMNALISD